MKRHQVYIPTQDGSLFGWLHLPNSESPRDTVVVICNPLGYEYAHSHRSIRHLADRLALTGIPALRFDYHGTGDSPGGDLDPQRLQSWKQSIRSAVRFAVSSTGCGRICLIGVHLGATLAALVSAEQEVDLLVLWNPAVSGKRYVREMQVISATASRQGPEEKSFIESAGFLISKETAEDLKKIDLLRQRLQVKDRVLVVSRDDLDRDLSLIEAIRALGIPVDERSLPGYAEMMMEPQFTRIPAAALGFITDWLLGNTREGSRGGSKMAFSRASGGNASPDLSERSFQFGGEADLFGILTDPDGTQTDPGGTQTDPGGSKGPASNRPVVVMLNAGSVHHVGPNRIYVTLARSLASHGYASFRLDIEGLGESVKPGAKNENSPYPDTAVPDTALALSFLKEQLGYRRFILVGLCSGAHTAFHSGIELSDYEIVDTVLINPLTFRWQEGMSLETTSAAHFQQAAHYRRTMRQMSSWIKILRGKVDIRNPLRVLWRQIKRVVSGLLISTNGSRLSQDLTRLFNQGRSMSLFIARQDPGYHLLMEGAKDLAKKSLKSGKIRLQFIEDADHTFSGFAPRAELISRLLAHISRPSGSCK